MGINVKSKSVSLFEVVQIDIPAQHDRRRPVDSPVPLSLKGGEKLRHESLKTPEVTDQKNRPVPKVRGLPRSGGAGPFVPSLLVKVLGCGTRVSSYLSLGNLTRVWSTSPTAA